MRNPSRHARPATFVALAVLVLATASDAFGQSRVADEGQAAAVARRPRGRPPRTPSPRTRRSYRPGEVVALSIFANGEEEDWTPLRLSTLFTDGWDEPWLAPPADSDMPVRQGWVNSADGLFFRNLVGVYQNTEGLPARQDANLGLFQFQSPLSRRLWISINVPFVTTLSDDGGPYKAAAFGDFSLTPRVMLKETRRFSLIAGLGVQTPTGSLSTGGGLARLNPNVQFWTDIGRRFSARGGIGVDVPLNQFEVLPTNLATNIAVGQTVTGHDVLLIGDFQYYLSANLRNNLGSGPGHAFFSLTPGFRTHLGGEYFLAGGYEIPLTGPQPYGNRLTFFFVKGF